MIGTPSATVYRLRGVGLMLDCLGDGYLGRGRPCVGLAARRLIDVIEEGDAARAPMLEEIEEAEEKDVDE